MSAVVHSDATQKNYIAGLTRGGAFINALFNRPDRVDEHVKSFVEAVTSAGDTSSVPSQTLSNTQRGIIKGACIEIGKKLVDIERCCGSIVLERKRRVAAYQLLQKFLVKIIGRNIGSKREGNSPRLSPALVESVRSSIAETFLTFLINDSTLPSSVSKVTPIVTSCALSNNCQVVITKLLDKSKRSPEQLMEGFVIRVGSSTDQPQSLVNAVKTLAVLLSGKSEGRAGELVKVGSAAIMALVKRQAAQLSELVAVAAELGNDEAIALYRQRTTSSRVLRSYRLPQRGSTIYGHER